MKSKLVKAALDLGVFLGLGLLIYGLRLLYPALAYMIGGVLLSFLCFILGYDKSRNARGK